MQKGEKKNTNTKLVFFSSIIFWCLCSEERVKAVVLGDPSQLICNYSKCLFKLCFLTNANMVFVHDFVGGLEVLAAFCSCALIENVLNE